MALLQDISASSLNSDDPQRQIESVVKQLNDWGRSLSNEDRSKISNDDSGTPRLLTGYQQDGFSNGNVGIKLSQVGVNVEEATDDQLIFSSDFNLFKIASSGTASVSISGTFTTFVPYTATIAHGQGTKPAFMVYVENPNYSTLPGLTASTASGLTATPLTVFFAGAGPSYGPLVVIQGRVDDTNLYIDVVNVTGLSSGFPSWTWNFKYYILKETAG